MSIDIEHTCLELRGCPLPASFSLALGLKASLCLAPSTAFSRHSLYNHSFQFCQGGLKDLANLLASEVRQFLIWAPLMQRTWLRRKVPCSWSLARPRGGTEPGNMDSMKLTTGLTLMDPLAFSYALPLAAQALVAL